MKIWKFEYSYKDGRFFMAINNKWNIFIELVTYKCY